MTKIKMRDVTNYIARREEFDAGSMRAMVNGTLSMEAIGQLPEPWSEQLVTTYLAGRLAYVVFSFDTPIAWIDTEGGVTIPPARFSMTTTQHQYRVADALAMGDWNAWGSDGSRGSW